jgi:uncharacterized protein YabN with tetrapyrrole methylase and pyrophosphatase domain
MPRISLELCKKANYPLLTIEHYIDVYKEKYKASMNYEQVYHLIRADRIDHVKHERSIYVVINHRSMDGLRTPRNAKVLVKKSRHDRAKWR